jgi:predicted HTH domain antitoxin
MCPPTKVLERLVLPPRWQWIPPHATVGTVSGVHIDLPDDTALALGGLPEGIAETVRMAAAAKLYELGRLSSGAAAQLAGVPRVVFLARLGEYGVPTFTGTEDELRQDAESA